jgi:hypothetical protein
MQSHPPLSFTIRQWYEDRNREAVTEPLLGVPSIPDPDNEFTYYIMLIGLQAQVCEAREIEALFSPRTQLGTRNLLLSWYKSYNRFTSSTNSNSNSNSSNFCLLILWHSIFVSLYTDIQNLEIAFGSQGGKAAGEIAESVIHWVLTPCAERAAFHIIRIRQLLSQLSLSIVPPIHLPRITFQSAIVYWCYIKYKELSVGPALGEHEEWLEFTIAGLNEDELMGELQRDRSAWNDQPLAPFSEVLQRLGQWGLSKKLGDILNVAIHEEAANMR